MKNDVSQIDPYFLNITSKLVNKLILWMDQRNMILQPVPSYTTKLTINAN